MFLTRSIRRKLCLGLGLIVVMLMAVASSAIVGLYSYRGMIDELEQNLRADPKRYELLAAAAHLTEPVLLRDGPVLEARIKEVKQQTREYFRKLEELPRTPGNAARVPVARSLLQQMDHDLGKMEAKIPALGSAQLGSVAQNELLGAVIRITSAAQNMPNPVEGLEGLWRESRLIYSSYWKAFLATMVLAIGLVTSLIYGGYVWIFRPIKTLHRAAARVAHGDLTVRVELHGQDEIVDLADSFNDMTQRFLDIKRDLDQQVMERSKQLVRSERLANVGFLAAGVAHEINNPLSAISMASESLSMRLNETPSSEAEMAEERDIARQYLTMIQEEGARCQQITSRLLDFARGQDAPRMRQDVSRIVQDVLAMVSHLGRFQSHRIEFHSTQPTYVNINGAEIKQVVLNLVANALESLGPSGGTLKIDIQDLADEVVLSFADNGCGMSPRVQSHLFEPFFTERKSGKGTGLGLSISNRIVNDHGGRIEVNSDGEGRGSTFRVRLPKRTAVTAAA